MKPRTGPTSTFGARCFGGSGFGAAVFFVLERFAEAAFFLLLAPAAVFFFDAARFFELGVFFLLTVFLLAFLLLPVCFADFFVTFLFETFFTGAFLAEVFFAVFLFEAADDFRACFLATLRVTFFREVFFAALRAEARPGLRPVCLFGVFFPLAALVFLFFLDTAFFAAITPISGTVENQAGDYTCVA